MTPPAPEPAPEPAAGLTEDTLHGGRVRLRQPAAGYRAGHDAVLLAAALDAPAGARALEFGCGAGAALLCAAARLTAVSFLGLEQDPALAALAGENAALNGVSDRVAARCADALAEPLAGYDLVFSNPPYFDDARTLRGPAPARVGAWLNPAGIGAWVGAMWRACAPRGTLAVIHRADALPALLAALPPGRAGDVRVRPIQPHPAAPAKRIVLTARRETKGPFVLLAPLALHPAAGVQAPTAAAAALLGGAGGLMDPG